MNGIFRRCHRKSPHQNQCRDFDCPFGQIDGCQPAVCRLILRLAALKTLAIPWYGCTFCLGMRNIASLPAVIAQITRNAWISRIQGCMRKSKGAYRKNDVVFPVSPCCTQEIVTLWNTFFPFFTISAPSEKSSADSTASSAVNF